MNDQIFIRTTIYIIVCVWFSSCSLTIQERTTFSDEIHIDQLNFYDIENGTCYVIPLHEALNLNFTRETSTIKTDSLFLSIIEVKGFVTHEGVTHHLQIEKISDLEGSMSLIGCTLTTYNQSNEVSLVSYCEQETTMEHYLWMQPGSSTYALVDNIINKAFQMHLELDRLKDKRPICEHIETTTFKLFLKKVQRSSPKPLSTPKSRKPLVKRA